MKLLEKKTTILPRVKDDVEDDLREDLKDETQKEISGKLRNRQNVSGKHDLEKQEDPVPVSLSAIKSILESKLLNSSSIFSSVSWKIVDGLLAIIISVYGIGNTVVAIQEKCIKG